jgi:hypothetical protein
MRSRARSARDLGERHRSPPPRAPESLTEPDLAAHQAPHAREGVALGTRAIPRSARAHGAEFWVCAQRALRSRGTAVYDRSVLPA